MVIFTTRIETQTSIRNFLEERGVSCLINGTTGAINKETLRNLEDDPDINVIISTEVGASVNLQVVNNWLIMILPGNHDDKQRIGRIQRLGSLHEKVYFQHCAQRNL